MSGLRSRETSVRIAHVQPLSIDLYGYADDEWGSTFRYFLPNMVAAQVARGDRPVVHLLSADHRHGHTEELLEGVQVVFHPSVEPQPRGGVEQRFSRQVSLPMLRALRSADADLIHFHGARSMQGPLAAVVARATQQRLAVVAQDHGPRSVGAFTRTLHRAALRGCDALLGANEESRAELRSIAPEVEVAPAPNGVDPAVFHPDPARAHGTPFRVLVVSRLMDDKDPLTAVAALVELVRRGHPLEVTVVGNGDLQTEVAARLRAGDVPARLVDKLPQDELAHEYRRAHAVLLTSRREGFNQATLEAMASGTPVVASDIPGVRDGVGEAGLLAPPGDVAAFVEHVQVLLTEPGRWEDLRRQSIAQAARFTWPEIVTGFDAVYRRAIERRAGRR